MLYMITKTEISAHQDKLALEPRRGILVLAILSRLGEPKYGYALIQELGEYGLEIEQGTLYPLLRRLGEQGLLISEWNVEGSRPRRYYQLSPAGAEVLRGLSKDWWHLVDTMAGLLETKGGK